MKKPAAAAAARRAPPRRCARLQLALHLGRARNSLDGKHDIVD
jgi:hypothetical protein